MAGGRRGTCETASGCPGARVQGRCHGRAGGAVVGKRTIPLDRSAAQHDSAALASAHRRMRWHGWAAGPSGKTIFRMRSRLLLWRDQVVRNGEKRKFKPSGNSGLIEDIRQVPLDGFFTQGELFGDVAIAAAFD